MKKTPVSLEEASRLFVRSLPKGILLNSRAETFNTMVIGWGAVGIIWGKPCVTVYVREGRFTSSQLDANPNFTISVPAEGLSEKEIQILGLSSGRDIDKVAKAGLTLAESSVNGVEGIREYPLTLECRILYSQKQDLSRIPEDVDASAPLANRDAHIMYIGEIVSSFTLED